MADGARYPAVMLTAGEFVPRVEAWQAKKVAAGLQAATAPILLRMEAGGHGIGQSLDQKTWSRASTVFLFDQLAVSYRPPAT